VENTTSEMGDPSYLRAFVEETRLTGLRLILLISATLTGRQPGKTSGVAHQFLEAMRETHLSAAPTFMTILATRTAHLPPHDGSIDLAGRPETVPLSARRGNSPHPGIKRKNRA